MNGVRVSACNPRGGDMNKLVVHTVAVAHLFAVWSEQTHFIEQALFKIQRHIFYITEFICISAR